INSVGSRAKYVEDHPGIKITLSYWTADSSNDRYFPCAKYPYANNSTHTGDENRCCDYWISRSKFWEASRARAIKRDRGEFKRLRDTNDHHYGDRGANCRSSPTEG